MSFNKFLLFWLFISCIWSCPYCAGQSGESYVQQVILPIGGLLLSPFVILGIVSTVIYLNRNKSRIEND